MKTIPVQVKGDFLERTSKVKPLLAIQELVWNGLDADATEVKVIFDLNVLGGIAGIHVIDDGDGISYDEVAQVFGSLGGSWKRDNYRSKRHNRILHGKAGRGRFRAFRLGQQVLWNTRYRSNLVVEEFSISGHLCNLETFELSDTQFSSSVSPGTEVIISDVTTNLSMLLGNVALEALTQHFALYLTNYPAIKIWYDGTVIDPQMAIIEKLDFQLDSVRLSDGTDTEVSLSIIEWEVHTSRTFILCDEDGFPRYELSSGMNTQGFDFTAYVKSAAFRQLDDENTLQLEELDADVQKLVEAAKEKVREHFRQKVAQASVDFIERWKKEHVYPYRGEAKTPIETAERQVFDVLAHALNTYLPGFSKAESKQKQFAMRLLKHSVETGPNEILTIMRDVLDLPTDKQAEFTRLLQKTTLTAVINAAKLVADRLDFLRGLEILLFDANTKDKLLERKQLHKILENETWVFGEEYNLTVSDQSLTEVLKKHINLLGLRSDSPPDNTPQVTLQDGSRGIIDLMLSRKIPQPDPKKREHLIIELKRPTQKIDDNVLGQVENYALAVAADERFRDTGTKWVFWALSNDITPKARKKCNQADRPAGLFYVQNDERIELWARTWGQVIEGCRARLTFYEEELKYSADDASALEYLNRTHDKYLPSHLTPAST